MLRLWLGGGQAGMRQGECSFLWLRWLLRGGPPSQGSNPGPAVKVLSANQLLDPWGVL